MGGLEVDGEELEDVDDEAKDQQRQVTIVAPTADGSSPVKKKDSKELSESVRMLVEKQSRIVQEQQEINNRLKGVLDQVQGMIRRFEVT